jgi:hypothetical protein
VGKVGRTLFLLRPSERHCRQGNYNCNQHSHRFVTSHSKLRGRVYVQCRGEHVKTCPSPAPPNGQAPVTQKSTVTCGRPDDAWTDRKQALAFASLAAHSRSAPPRRELISHCPGSAAACVIGPTGRLGGRKWGSGAKLLLRGM